VTAVSDFLDVWGARALLALALVACVVTGLITPYVLGVLGVAMLLWKASNGTLWVAYRNPAAVALAAVFVVLVVSFSITAKQPQDALFAINFIMLILFAPFLSALERRRSERGSLVVGRLALLGALLSVAVILVMIGFVGGRRSTSGLIGVIVLANTAVLLGFLSLIGVAADRGWRRWAYLLGPVAGVVTVLLTQSRGPLIALGPLSIVGAIFLARSLKIKWPYVTGGLLVAFLSVATWVISLGGRMARLPHIFWALLSGDTFTDRTTEYRLDLYQAAWRAYQQSPIIGHGWARIMEAAAPFLNNPKLAKLPQLHNDLADLGVASGLIGVACYVALLATPIVAAVISVQDSQYRLRLYGSIVLSIAYFCDGLTDLMFGFEFHTALYTAILAILLGYCRDREATL
jgi:O-antigen ligase